MGCSRRLTSIVVSGAGIAAATATGSGLNWPAALTVTGPTHAPPSENCPVVKSVSAIAK